MHFQCSVSALFIFSVVLLTLIILFEIISSILHIISGFTPVHQLESYLEFAVLHLVLSHSQTTKGKYNQTPTSCVMCVLVRQTKNPKRASSQLRHKLITFHFYFLEKCSFIFWWPTHFVKPNQNILIAFWRQV